MKKRARLDPLFSDGGEWIADLGTPDEVRHFRVKRRLFSGRSQFHKVEVVELAGHGRALFLNDCARVFTSDEYIYHESLVHPAIQLARVPKGGLRVLLIGDGDGGAVRELLGFREVKQVTWVEIDRVVVDACLEHLRLLPRAKLDGDRLRLVIAEGAQFIAETDHQFDVIILSVTDPEAHGVEHALYSSKVYFQLMRILAPKGLFCRSVCSLTPLTAPSFVRQAAKIMESFARVIPFSVGLPSFGIDWGFVIASRDLLQAGPWTKRGPKPKFISPAHFAAMRLRTQLSQLKC